MSERIKTKWLVIYLIVVSLIFLPKVISCALSTYPRFLHTSQEAKLSTHAWRKRLIRSPGSVSFGSQFWRRVC